MKIKCHGNITVNDIMLKKELFPATKRKRRSLKAES